MIRLMYILFIFLLIRGFELDFKNKYKGFQVLVKLWNDSSFFYLKNLEISYLDDFLKLSFQYLINFKYYIC